jgi:hypothetical protein
MSKYQKITSFANIVKKNKTLVICDIDETIMHFTNGTEQVNDNWWDQKKQQYMETLGCDSKTAGAHAYQEWHELVKTTKPQFTDSKGFVKMLDKLNKKNSDIIFLTARKQDTRDLTHQHLTMLNIDPNGFELHFTSLNPKGPYIKSNIDINKYKQIIFIDDAKHNLDSVYETFNGQIECYHFSLINEHH